MIASALSQADCPFSAAGTDIYTQKDFAAIARITHDASGIVLPEGKAMLVYSRLARRLRERGVARFAAYVELIEKDAEERARAVTLLTTNHTMFYREAHHFDHFDQHVRGGLVQKLLAGDRVRLWSAGCSSGEEIYSLAMTLLGSDASRGRQIAARDLAILGSDLSDTVLTHAAAAKYPRERLAAVPAQLRTPWVRAVGNELEMAPELRQITRFRRLNLLGDWPFAGSFDVIFCRNVMIYFDEPTKARLLARFADRLAENGHLYIGHSERLVGPAASQFTLVGNTTYKKVRA